MKIKWSRTLTTVLSLVSAFSLAACAVPGGTPSASASTGTVEMWVTDAPRSDNVSEIWVTVNAVSIHKAPTANLTSNISDNVSGDTSGNQTDNETDAQEDTTPENPGEWITVNITSESRFDLMTLKGSGNGSGLQQILATADLAAGHYTQIRMTVSKVEVKLNGILKDATLPSGKLKFVRPFDVEAGNVTKLLFDFNADKFVNVTGNPNNPNIIVKPVIKLTVSAPGPSGDRPEGNQTGNNTTNMTGNQGGQQNAAQGKPENTPKNNNKPLG